MFEKTGVAQRFRSKHTIIVSYMGLYAQVHAFRSHFGLHSHTCYVPSYWKKPYTSQDLVCTFSNKDVDIPSWLQERLDKTLLTIISYKFLRRHIRKWLQSVERELQVVWKIHTAWEDLKEKPRKGMPDPAPSSPRLSTFSTSPFSSPTSVQHTPLTAPVNFK